MNLILSCSSKTFLSGEYAVLAGGEAVLVATKPCFELYVQFQGEGLVQGIHPQSPAGRLVRQLEFSGQTNLQFVDPHGGRGGFGASSAQYLLVKILAEFWQRNGQSFFQSLEAQKIWSEFRSLDVDNSRESDGGETHVHAGERTDSAVLASGMGSGADLLAQFQGGFSLFSSTPFNLRSLTWPFSRLALLLVRTGKKISTHEHLATLDKIRLRELIGPAKSSSEAFQQGKDNQWLETLAKYTDCLNRLGLVAPHTESLLQQLRLVPGYCMAKGCGALGADTVAVVIEQSHKAKAISWLVQNNLECVATESDVSSGWQLQAVSGGHIDLSKNNLYRQRDSMSQSNDDHPRAVGASNSSESSMMEDIEQALRSLENFSRDRDFT